MAKGIFFGLVGFVVIVALMAMTSYNRLVRSENRIQALQSDMQNVHASIYRQMGAQGLAVEKYGEMVIDALHAAMSGRYGDKGAQGAFLWIQEQNPNIDPKIFEKLQTVIEAGYNRFEAVQREKIDVVRTYKDQLRVFPTSLFASFFGFPKIDLSAAERLVTSAETKRDFETGELSEPKLFQK